MACTTLVVCVIWLFIRLRDVVNVDKRGQLDTSTVHTHPNLTILYPSLSPGCIPCAYTIVNVTNHTTTSVVHADVSLSNAVSAHASLCIIVDSYSIWRVQHWLYVSYMVVYTPPRQLPLIHIVYGVYNTGCMCHMVVYTPPRRCKR